MDRCNSEWMRPNSLNTNHCCSNKLTFSIFLLRFSQFQDSFVFRKFSIGLTSQPMILFCDLNFVPIFMSSANTYTLTYISISNARNQKLSHFSLLKWNERNGWEKRRHNKFKARIDFAHYILKMETNYIYVTFIIISISVSSCSSHQHLQMDFRWIYNRDWVSFFLERKKTVYFAIKHQIRVQKSQNYETHKTSLEHSYTHFFIVCLSVFLLSLRYIKWNGH